MIAPPTLLPPKYWRHYRISKICSSFRWCPLNVTFFLFSIKNFVQLASEFTCIFTIYNFPWKETTELRHTVVGGIALFFLSETCYPWKYCIERDHEWPLPFPSPSTHNTTELYHTPLSVVSIPELGRPSLNCCSLLISCCVSPIIPGHSSVPCLFQRMKRHAKKVSRSSIRNDCGVQAVLSPRIYTVTQWSFWFYSFPCNFTCPKRLVDGFCLPVMFASSLGNFSVTQVSLF